ncbi:hypothetical protein HID58_002485 [Brassica napus]|uniref:Serine-threonine/tyrosine-protein kinase catalytic domain-containing protein n=1 Tax=Brassica napus TaxID=3708 RepID=A0ABQ8EQ34_BRANA|nr:hypothetical protein HID58_002485 [Brassica napus]
MIRTETLRFQGRRRREMGKRRRDTRLGLVDGLILGALFLQPSFLVRVEETGCLKDALGNEILKLKDQLGSRQKAISFFERDNSSNYLIPACIEIPTDGTDEWEIDVKQFQIEKKVASWFIWGDLHRGTYCSLEVAIKFLKPERIRYGIVKVADFGVVRVQIESGVMTAETGTHRWMAPEGLRPKIPKKTHPKVKGLLQRCWNQDPKDRPEFEEIIEMLQQIMIEVNVVP